MIKDMVLVVIFRCKRNKRILLLVKFKRKKINEILVFKCKKK
jgi:hypothetical protein